MPPNDGHHELGQAIRRNLQRLAGQTDKFLAERSAVMHRLKLGAEAGDAEAFRQLMEMVFGPPPKNP